MKIKNTGDITPTNLNCLVYGESGAGKTTLAGTLEGKTLVVSLEAGLLSLKSKNVDYVDVEGNNGAEKITFLRNLLGEIVKSDYENVFFDSLTEISQYFVEYAKVDYPDDRQTMKMYGHYNNLITSFIKFTRDMNKNVIFTCLQKTDKDEVGRRFTVPDMIGSISTKCPAYFDFVFNLMVIKKEDELHRALLTKLRDGVIAKDRSGALNEFESPDLGKIINKVFKENRKNV